MRFDVCNENETSISSTMSIKFNVKRKYARYSSLMYFLFVSGKSLFKYHTVVFEAAHFQRKFHSLTLRKSPFNLG